MELKTKDGFIFIEETVWNGVKGTVLEIRKTIIKYNKTKNENILNKACRLCNEFIKATDGV